MNMLFIVGIVAGVVIAMVVLCVVMVTMCRPKEYKGDLGSAGCGGPSGKTTVIFVGRKEALGEKAELLESVADSDLAVKCVELDPATLRHGWGAKMSAKRKLQSLVSDVGFDGAIVLLECSGDTSWTEWMVYAVANGLKRVAVPARLLDAGQIPSVRSGVASYRKLDTLDDLKEIVHATLWEAQKLAYASK